MDFLKLIVEQGNALYLYLSLSIALIGGAFGIPIPEDLPLILGGFLVGREQLQLAILFPVLYLSIILGDLILYTIAYYFGRTLLNHPRLAKRFPEEKMQKLSEKLEKHAWLVIFFARHLFYLRTITFLACGIFKVNVVKFVIIDSIAALVSTSIMISIGFMLSSQMDNFMAQFEAIHSDLALTGVILSGVLLAALIVYRLIKRRSERL